MKETPTNAGHSRSAFTLLLVGLLVLLAGGVAVAQAGWPVSASSGDNGVITPAGTVYIADGAGQAFAFIPSRGYMVYQVIVDGSVVAGNVPGYTFNAVHGQHSILVTFTPIPGITYYNPGVVILAPDLYLFGGVYDRGRDVHDYSRRGHESREVAHPERRVVPRPEVRGPARPSGGDHGGKR